MDLESPQLQPMIGVCKAWGGSLFKAEWVLASRLAKIKCTDVLWVGAHEAPKTRGSDRARWRSISDASSVGASEPGPLARLRVWGGLGVAAAVLGAGRGGAFIETTPTRMLQMPQDRLWMSARPRRRPVPKRFAPAVVALAALLLPHAGPAAAQPAPGAGDYFANHPGRSLGIPACVGNVAHASCFRIDDPAQPDACLQRDPVTHACLVTAPNYAYSSTVLPPDPQRAHVSTLGGTRSCDASDPTCVPGGIHTLKDIDWSQVEGAEFMMTTRKELEGSMNIYVDAAGGNDHSGWGTPESPLRSLRAGLKRWLMPGKCYPFCGSSSLSRSGTLHVRPGVYSGTDNREIELLIDSGVSVTIRVENERKEREGDNSVQVRIEGGAYWLKASGKGTLSLLSMSVHNSSSDAILVGPSIALVTDLHYAHGRHGQVLRTLDASGNVVTSANWDIQSDERYIGKDYQCDANGCAVIRRKHEFDARYHGPLPAATSPCTTCSVPAPTPAPGLAPDSRWNYGIGAILTSGGTGCIHGGTLTAVSVAGVSGSGFSATFTVANGAVSGISVTDHGSGYVGVQGVSIRIEVGGDGCTGVAFLPYLVYDTNFL